MSTVQGDDRLEGEASQEPQQEQPPAPEQPQAQEQAPTPRRRAGQQGQGTRSRRREAAPVEEPQDGPAESGAQAPAEMPAPRLLESYRSDVVPAMMQEFGYKSVMQVPRIQKVVVNIGLGEALTNQRAMESAAKDLTTISGQKPIVTRARKSIAGFKLRKGNQIGMCVTLRGPRMYHFMDRLLNASLPRIRDFRGVSPRSFDGRGNYSLGIREQIIFPEIDYGQIERIRGLQVTVITSARTDQEANRLLSLLGMPFARQNFEEGAWLRSP